MQVKNPSTRTGIAKRLVLVAMLLMTSACTSIHSLATPASPVPGHSQSQDQPTLQAELARAIDDHKMADVQRLLDANASPDFLLASKLTPLSQAANQGDVELATMLLEHGAEIGMYNQNEYGTIALIEAAQNGHVELVRLLLNRGADINQRDRFGDPALNWATYYGRTEVVRLLLAQHATLTVVGSGGGTALNTSIAQKHPEIEKLLRDAGATE